MTATVIDGKAIAAALVAGIAKTVERLVLTQRLTPGLAVVLIGDNPASTVYVRNKVKQCELAGLRSQLHHLPADVREDDVINLVRGLNGRDDVHGILVQLPLPPQVRAAAVIETIDPAKDVDGFHVVNVGRLFGGLPGALVPCTPQGCLHLIFSVRRDLSGLAAVVIGRSSIVGKPMAQLLLDENCTVTIAHSRSADLPAICRGADLLIAAVGRPQMVRQDWIKPGAIVIDVGINRVADGRGGSRLVGDVDFAAALTVASAITPVPGGVGPMTVALLLRNTLIAACRQRGIDEPEV
ncbi:MAG: bifunctional methylenetetrahydrofolate dehydrogenase/methenyltetrahydrofolate cyclohydrolase FolD [Rhodospirillales bacterium]|jgi:methylenetetrahydrofolate dehydrogenase (NADP+)/methenyltetrahydrofolate cyclohydrolase|nr:bifunctional methylenetetrahydrofolate dehydrogenase/methenyltetrahydrofolate cyclohydrolase FolD [Rhodospirillales bacterium]